MSARANVGKRMNVVDFKAAKGGAPLVCLTAYTAPMARLADAHADLVLVGDSLGMVLYGMESTVPVTLAMMEAHGRAVAASCRQALVVVDMPFGSYQESPAQAYRNASSLLKATGAAAVKLEGGLIMAETVEFLTARGIAVMGHVGLQPQSVLAEGGYRVKGLSNSDHDLVVADAISIDNAGAFAIVLECVTPDIAASVTRAVVAPIIGIGASAACDGQILVAEDMLGLGADRVPRFVKSYASLSGEIDSAMAAYAAEVRQRQFPGAAQLYGSAARTLPAEKQPVTGGVGRITD